MNATTTPLADPPALWLVSLLYTLVLLGAVLLVALAAYFGRRIVTAIVFLLARPLPTVQVET